MNYYILSALTNQDYISLLQAFLIAGTIFYAARQYKRTKITDSSNTLIKTIEILQSDEFINARGHVLKELQSKPYKEWSVFDIKNAETACRNYDTACLMNEILKYPENIKLVSIKWNNSIIKIYEICNPIIKSYQAERGSGFWNHLDMLYEEAGRQNTDNTDFMKM